ncbi:hypothetical protein STEG23_020769, partial [Scotinomys teguina]
MTEQRTQKNTSSASSQGNQTFLKPEPESCGRRSRGAHNEEPSQRYLRNLNSVRIVVNTRLALHDLMTTVKHRETAIRANRIRNQRRRNKAVFADSRWIGTSQESKKGRNEMEGGGTEDEDEITAKEL